MILSVFASSFAESLNIYNREPFCCIEKVFFFLMRNLVKKHLKYMKIHLIAAIRQNGKRI